MSLLSNFTFLRQMGTTFPKKEYHVQDEFYAFKPISSVSRLPYILRSGSAQISDLVEINCF